MDSGCHIDELNPCHTLLSLNSEHHLVMLRDNLGDLRPAIARRGCLSSGKLLLCQ